ncbi:Aste57867_9730 [Aphanomyces stellatus]|uniref:Aste57867_9730 protein n=1 Tax=Aphanomyces stellatus TaxID=120398 RepID=A0A485KP93_9STRA|nr:hypothetical protein As57867_009692 [Aphanomyces stellatus]VFT86609.1 Aste57867_9730 [Aphanomyces stellatus]
MLASTTLAALLGLIVAQSPAQIGTSFPLSIVGPAGTSLTREIKSPGASYLAIHFQGIDLAPGATLTLSTHDDVVRVTAADAHNFADYLVGDSVLLTYTAPLTASNATPAFTIDSFVAGEREDATEPEAICGADNTQAAVCVRDSDPLVYTRAQAVSRLLIQGKYLCTGWLFGSEGHLVTNNHCIRTAEAAANVQVEFEAECKTCDDPNNAKSGKCKGKVVATSGTLVQTSPEHDFTLIKLHLKAGVDDLSKYGYLQARATGPVLHEEIYIAQHPAGKPKRVALVVDDGSRGVVTKASMKSCKPDEIGYMLDTQGGASGSPVLSGTDHTVVALHNCGGCNNGGIQIHHVLQALEAAGNVPQDAVADDNDNDGWSAWLTDVDLPEGDLQATAHADAAACRIDCKATPSCQAFVWTTDGMCYLKDLGFGESVPLPGAKAAIKLTSAACGDVLTNTDLTGDDLASTNQVAPSLCCQDCHAMDDCHAFVWTDFNGGTCWLKRDVGDETSYDGAYAVLLS